MAMSAQHSTLQNTQRINWYRVWFVISVSHECHRLLLFILASYAVCHTAISSPSPLYIACMTKNVCDWKHCELCDRCDWYAISMHCNMCAYMLQLLATDIVARTYILLILFITWPQTQTMLCILHMRFRAVFFSQPQQFSIRCGSATRHTQTNRQTY